MADKQATRQVRAAFTADTITVYQAYSSAIAEPALNTGRFVPPFKLERMTWIKPSFLWMAYRCGWATKPNQERVLAIEITRDGFEWALAHSCLSHYDATIHDSHEHWKNQLANSPVRIQWDPERDIQLQPLDHRSIQIGLGGEAVNYYINNWTVSITDSTHRFHEIHRHVEAGQVLDAQRMLPNEDTYPIPTNISEIIGSNQAANSSSITTSTAPAERSSQPKAPSGDGQPNT